MKPTLIVGALTIALAAGGLAACGGGTSGSGTTGAKAPVTTPASDIALKTTVKPDLSSGGSPAPGAPAPAGTPDASAGVRYSLVLGDTKTGFPFNAVTLSDDTKAAIDAMFTDGKVDLKDARFLIEGHTDNVGSKAANDRVGLARAEAVKRYLAERYEVPDDLMSVVSCGADEPVADNATDEGRALNRRVVIKVLN